MTAVDLRQLPWSTEDGCAAQLAGPGSTNWTKDRECNTRTYPLDRATSGCRLKKQYRCEAERLLLLLEKDPMPTGVLTSGLQLPLNGVTFEN